MLSTEEHAFILVQSNLSTENSIFSLIKYMLTFEDSIFFFLFFRLQVQFIVQLEHKVSWYLMSTSLMFKILSL